MTHMRYLDMSYYQRRLRHMTAIFGRNFAPVERGGEPRPYHSYFTLALTPTRYQSALYLAELLLLNSHVHV